MADNSWLWLNEDLSDVRIRLACTKPPARAAVIEPQQAPATSDGCQVTDAPGTMHGSPSSTEVCMEVPAHSVVLASASGYWKARVLRWRTGAETKPTEPAAEPPPPPAAAAAAATAAAVASRTRKRKHTEQGDGPQKKKAAQMAASGAAIGSTAAETAPGIMVDQVDSPDDMEAARSILQYAYTYTLPKKATVVQCLQMAMCADKWGMKQAVAACMDLAAHTEILTVNDINRVLDDGLAPIKADGSFNVLISHCIAALMKVFGRAQVVLSEPGSRKAFCGLSLNAVQLWAQQDALTVDSENTVAVLFTHWWYANISNFTEGQINAARTVLTQALRARYLTPSFLLCVLEQLPWFKPTAEAAAALKIKSASQAFHQCGALCGVMPAGWMKPPRSLISTAEAVQAATMDWVVTKAQLDQLHKDAAKGEAIMHSDNSLYCSGYRWFLCLGLKSQKEALKIAMEFRSAMDLTTERLLNLPPVLPATFHLIVRRPDGDISQPCDFTKGHPLLVNVLYGSDTVLGIRATSEPRPNSYPPDKYWTNGKLHLQLKIMQVW